MVKEFLPIFLCSSKNAIFETKSEIFENQFLMIEKTDNNSLQIYFFQMIVFKNAKQKSLSLNWPTFLKPVAQPLPTAYR